MPISGLPEPQGPQGLFYLSEAMRRDAGYESKHTNSGGPINWQPWRQPPAPEYGVETCSNVAIACEGYQNQQSGAAVSGPRIMGFQNEFEKVRYLSGLGLPAEGDSSEARLFRVLNMVCFYCTLVWYEGWINEWANFQ